MFSFLLKFFQKNQINLVGACPLSATRIRRPYLLERVGIESGTVISFAVPYLTHAAHTAERNLSAYAVSRDYHLYFEELFQELLPLLRERYPSHRFAGFSDHSPIDEVHAAARAGLGIIGDNRLLITKEYASYVFLGEIITDALIESPEKEIETCSHCGACKKACPMTEGSPCLSSLTQKKGELTPEEVSLLARHPLIWGCDTCQEVCPHTKRTSEQGTIYTPIPYFHESPIPTLTEKVLENMSDTEFSRRAYAWRKRETVKRNLAIKEEANKC